MYHLHRALNAGRIDLDRFIKVPTFSPFIHSTEFELTFRFKTTRELAEEQFIKRALIEKIEQGLPIGSRGPWI
jgi:ESCRT-I complex subunit TSG101